MSQEPIPHVVLKLHIHDGIQHQITVEQSPVR